MWRDNIFGTGDAQFSEIHPLGETRPVTVNVRVIPATNQPLDRLLADGRFREDFSYRLNVMRFHLPLLRGRPEEILPASTSSSAP